ncbi:zinc finger protein 420-like [Malaya genurostris]|uniref:zinc finger protein 420-like n=1 Tax=Malaya genurostris TaxID=325434 RepID=UPI0026F4087A|nr:zinc finger protein 420-like [Malaya genurostris]
MEIPLNIDRTCRTCLRETESTTSIFCDDYKHNCKIFLMITACSDMKIEENDGLPDKICSECIDSVRNAYVFKQQCEIAYQTLQSLITQCNLAAESSEKADKNYKQIQEVDAKGLLVEVEYLPESVDILTDQSKIDLILEQGTCKIEVFENVEYLSENIDEVVKQENVEPIDSLNAEIEEFIDGPYSPGLNEAERESFWNKVKNKAVQSSVKNQSCNKQCQYCDKVFSRATHLRRHLLTHTKEKHFKCKICLKPFSRSDHLSIHESTFHSQERPFPCQLCEKSFKRAEHLRTHVESKHSESAVSKKQEFCDICNKGFTSARYLDVHKKTHSEEKVYNCKSCDLKFSEKNDHRQHMKREHQDGTTFLCSECGQSFMRNDYLLVHMRRHNGIKPYKCKFCTKAFPRATDLRVHEKYHTNEKAHLCTICGKGFHRAYNLLVHSRTHNGLKPYQCPHCPKSFAQGNDLKAHVRRHTGERYKCDICNEGFIQCYQLNNHKRTVHNIDSAANIRRVTKFLTPTAQEQQVLFQKHHARLQQLVAQRRELEEQQQTWSVEQIEHDPDVEKKILETNERILDVERDLEDINNRLHNELERQSQQQLQETDQFDAILEENNEEYNPIASNHPRFHNDLNLQINNLKQEH